MKILYFISLVLFSLTANGQKNNVADDNKIFNRVEHEAEFDGGMRAWTAYLQENLHSNVPVKKKAPAGTYQVIVRFIVASDGKIKDVVAETNHGYGMEAEVVRIIKKCPRWIPAMQSGNQVNSYRRQPVTFKVVEK